MDKIMKINKIKPENTQLIIRTDLEISDWFIHFYEKEYVEGEGWRKSKTLFRGYYNDKQIETILDEIIKWCLIKSDLKDSQYDNL